VWQIFVFELATARSTRPSAIRRGRKKRTSNRRFTDPGHRQIGATRSLALTEGW
jgi:hypothetical protein